MGNSSTYRFLDKALVPVGKQTFIVSSKAGADTAIQWINNNASGASTITVYGTTEPDIDRLKASGLVIDPAASPNWFQLPTQFAVQPTAAIGTQILPIADDPHTFVAIDVVTGTQHASLSILANVKERGS